MKIYIEVSKGCVGRVWATKQRKPSKSKPLVFVIDCDGQDEDDSDDAKAAIGRLERDKTVDEVYP